MATTNRDRITRGLDLLRDGLKPFVERELKAKHTNNWRDGDSRRTSGPQPRQGR